jgi:hypothetical protein
LSYIPGGNSPLITITEVGVAGASDHDIGEVLPIMTHIRGILSMKSDPIGGTRMTENGKVEGNEELKCGVNSLAPISSTITSSGSKALTSGELWSTISVGPIGKKVSD